MKIVCTGLAYVQWSPYELENAKCDEVFFGKVVFVFDPQTPFCLFDKFGVCHVSECFF